MGPEDAQRIYDLLDEVDEKIQALTDKINGILDWIPWGLGWVVDKFMDLWNKAMDKLAEFWAKVQEFAAKLGAPWDLDAAKNEWATVGGPVAARGVEASRSQSEVDYEWKGRAADRYAFALADQQKALTAVRDKLTSVVAPPLGDLASALYIFFGAIAVAVAALITAIVLATGETGTIIGLPAVPVTIAAGLVVAIGAITTAVLNLRGAASSANTTFLNVRNAQSDFGAENWPPAVVG